MGRCRVGPQAIQEYLGRMRERYDRADRAAKGPLLGEVCEMTGYHRKAVIRLLGRPARPRRRRRGGPPVQYGPDVVAVLRAIWTAAGYPWSVRLNALLPLWLPWARRHVRLTDALEAQVRRISPRQIDRCLRADKRTLRRRPYGRTKPGTLLKHQIPLRTDRWDVQEPGFTEIDLVAHAGDRADGEFLHSLKGRVAALVTLQQTIDPFALAQRIDHALAAIYQLANHRRGSARMDAARPVDAKNASTRSLENHRAGFPQRPHASLLSSVQSPVT